MLDNERPNQADGGHFESDKGKTTCDVISGASGANPGEDGANLKQAFDRQKGELENLYKSGKTNSIHLQFAASN